MTPFELLLNDILNYSMVQRTFTLPGRLSIGQRWKLKGFGVTKAGYSKSQDATLVTL